MRPLSPQVYLEWQGWRSDTVTLQRHGWEFVQEKNVEQRAIRFLLKNPVTQTVMRTEMISEDFLYRFSMSQGREYFPVVHIAHVNFVEQRIPSLYPGAVTYTNLDMEPLITHAAQDFNPFSVFREADSGLLVPDDTVPDLLAKIQELQEPSRQERLQEQVKQRAGEQGTKITSAKIIQFAA